MTGTDAHPHAGTAGFTLVEVLVTLAILGLVASMLLGAMHSAAVMVRHSSSKSTEVSEVFRAQAVLRARIERMIALPANRAIGATEMVGSPVELEFVAPAADHEQPGGLKRYKLRLTPTGDLTLYSIDLFSDQASAADAPTGWQTARLLGNVAQLSLLYGDERGWYPYWSSRSDLPLLVRIAVRRLGDRQRWHVLAVHPGALGSLACSTDDTGTRCEASS